MNNIVKQNGNCTMQLKSKDWVGLSDDEIEQAILLKNKAGAWWGMCLDIARAIEQALKEKNHGTPN